jgi:hypothetical protein
LADAEVVAVSVLATLSSFGVNAQAIWVFAAGVLTMALVLVVIGAAIQFIKALLNGGG